MRSAGDIQRLSEAARSRFQERDARYLNNHYAYLGEYDKLSGTVNYAHPLRDVAHVQRETQMQVWNLIKPMVDAHRVLLDRMPLIRVPPAKMGDPLAAEFADKQEKVYYALWDASYMKRQHSMGSHNTALYYSTVWFVRWDNELDHPVITARRPSECYPVTKRNGQDLAACMFVWQENAEVLAENYPEVKKRLANTTSSGSPGLLDVIEYIDDKHYGMVVGGEFVSLAKDSKHDLGFVPVVITPGAYIPEGVSVLFPPGPVDQLVTINDFVNKMQTKWGVAIERNLFPGIYLSGENPRDVVVNNGPGGVTYGDGDTNIDPMPTPDIPREMFVLLEQAQTFMRVAGNYPEAASGMYQGSIVTGKAIHNLQSAMNGMAAESLDSIGDGLKLCNRYMFKMLEQYRPRKTFSLYSSETFTTRSAPGRPNNFAVELTPNEDINGYYANEVTYSPMGADFVTSSTILMQLKQAGVVSSRWIMNQIPGVEDAEGMQAEIEEEMRRRLQLEADMQIMVQQKIQEGQMKLQQMQQEAAAGQAPAGMPAEGGGPAGDAQMLGNTLVMPGGGPSMMGMGPPATGEEGFPMDYTELRPFNQAMDQILPRGGGEEPGLTDDLGPDAVTVEEVQETIGSVRNLKGEVFIGGELAKNGVTEGTIVLYITNNLDKATITNAVRDTRLWSRIEFVPIPEGEQPPDAIPVTGGIDVPVTA